MHLTITLIAISLASLLHAQTLGDWAPCTSSSQCIDGCCSQEYSATLKCTPNMSGAASCVGSTSPPPASGLGDWSACSSSSQCTSACCSQQYSTTLKCTPAGSSNQCVAGTTSTSTPTPSVTPAPTGSSLGDWSPCSSSSQCTSACCSQQYSTTLKCTPAGSSNQCVAGTTSTSTSATSVTPAPTGSSLGDWSPCSSSSQCTSACCSQQYSTTLKCTPAGSSNQCVAGTSSTTTSTSPAPTGTNLGDWSPCTTSSQCANACCSQKYSPTLKCTPGLGAGDASCVRSSVGANGTGRYQFYKYSPDVSILAALVPRSEKVVLQGRLPEVSYDNISPILNGTHSYELDLTTGGFYTQHVVTNMFCGATTIVPDNIGRMLTVGGWMDRSLMAVRLYKPTGGPGVASQNDWEENRNVTHLKVPRWYPTVITLPSGEILMIGGATENNDNIEQPNAEYIPPRAANPTNIPLLAGKGSSSQYPNCAVMPSGSLFVMAAQSSQLLSLSTLAPIKTLPDVADGLRTYPCLGGFTILPLAPPYTNAEVIVCGGCSGQGPALQNCGRITPELANPTWSYENMPLKRVMGNFIQLPDGKLLSINGAQYGSAGFAAATNPQLTALIYDPEASAGSRFSIGGTTNIPRMYHSCATLLADGRVLISGSDAFDPKNFPPERRLEFYIPSYYDQPRPTMSLGGGRDVGYNSLLTVNVVLKQAGAVRFNMIKIGGNTHSVSFDQRLLWLTATAIGGSYSLKMPPNGNVAPPGWYALHVVENGVPSVASWIRIGGDPSNLWQYPGNDPNFNMSGLSKNVNW